MGKEWYDMIAQKNNGYKSDAIYLIEGFSAEDLFEDQLIELLANSENALDCGCGDGEFTLRMGRFSRNLVGCDNSEALLNIAKDNLKDFERDNVSFVYGWTKAQSGLPFKKGSFDLIYSRRGPTSIIEHPELLKKGGIITGIHSAKMDEVIKKLELYGYLEIECDIYDDAVAIFPCEEEFLKYFSAIPGNPDYTKAEFSEEAEKIVQEHTVHGRLMHRQWRYIWKAVKP